MRLGLNTLSLARPSQVLEVLPSLALTPPDTQSLVAGALASSITGFAGTDTIPTSTPTLLVNGTPPAGGYALAANDVVTVRYALSGYNSATALIDDAVEAAPTAPAQITDLAVTSPADNEVAYAFTAPSNGGSEITGYTLYVAGDPVDIGLSTSGTLTGQAAGTYNITVEATNAIGTGLLSDPEPVTVAGDIVGPVLGLTIGALDGNGDFPIDTTVDDESLPVEVRFAAYLASLGTASREQVRDGLGADGNPAALTFNFTKSANGTTQDTVSFAALAAGDYRLSAVGIDDPGNLSAIAVHDTFTRVSAAPPASVAFTAFGETFPGSSAPIVTTPETISGLSVGTTAATTVIRFYVAALAHSSASPILVSVNGGAAITADVYSQSGAGGNVSAWYSATVPEGTTAIDITIEPAASSNMRDAGVYVFATESVTLVDSDTQPQTDGTDPVVVLDEQADDFVLAFGICDNGFGYTLVNATKQSEDDIRSNERMTYSQDVATGTQTRSITFDSAGTQNAIGVVLRPD